VTILSGVNVIIVECMVTEEEATALVTRLICQGRHLDPSQVSETTNLVDELGFDSLDAAELLAAVHKETGLELNIDSIKAMHTVRDIAQGLASLPDRRKVSI
jgi:acyl carrier protein